MTRTGKWPNQERGTSPTGNGQHGSMTDRREGERVERVAPLTGNAVRLMIAAAILAFGFVYVHPFVDGNGRLHRYLIHHVLAGRGFNPAGVVFPVSSAILENIGSYRTGLEDYSKRLLPVIEWDATPEGNVEVRTDTGDFYRFFDATPHAEFLYECVRKTIDEDLPRETEFLRRYDQFRAVVETVADVPERTIDLLFRFLHQNHGSLSKRRGTRSLPRSRILR